MWEMVKNETIIAVMEMLKDKRNTYQKIHEVTGASMGTIARIKQGKVKPNREAVFKQSENALKLVELEKENEELKKKVNSLESKISNLELEKKFTANEINRLNSLLDRKTSPKLEKNNSLKKIDLFNKE